MECVARFSLCTSNFLDGWMGSDVSFIFVEADEKNQWMQNLKYEYS